MSGPDRGPAHDPVRMSTPTLVLLAVLAFLTELAMFGGAGAVAYAAVGSGAWAWVAAVAATVAVLVLWGLVMAPKAPYRLAPRPRTVAAVVLVYGIAFGLVWAGFDTWAWIVGLAGVAVVAAQTVLHRPADPGPVPR